MCLQHTTLAEAPDFSIPDTSNKFEFRDSADPTRAIRPGEIFFLTPMAAKNKDTVTRYLETRLVQEDGIIVEFGKVEVPAGDTMFIPIQGRSILKRNLYGDVTGDVIQVRAEVDSAFDVWIAADEKLSSEHTGVE